MCLLTKHKIRLAKRDITVTRTVIKLTENTWCGYFYSYTDFLFNEIVTARTIDGKEITNLIQTPTCCDSSWYTIEEGFHSKRILDPLDYNCIPIEYICIIPKGSEYCYGINSEVVSTKIIVFSSYKEYFKYKWKKLLEKIS